VKVEVTYEQPVKPPLKEVIVTFTPEEVHKLRAILGNLIIQSDGKVVLTEGPTTQILRTSTHALKAYAIEVYNKLTEKTGRL
jgi:hypothetical protein